MKLLNYLTSIVSSFALIMFIASCGGGSTEQASSEEAAEEPMEEEIVEVPEMIEAMASMSPASGSDVTGTITFVQTSDNTVEMSIEIEHLAPGQHAIHLHQNGDCSAEDATSAGGHWNPAGVDHGNRMGDGVHHAGDIINLEAGADSTATNVLEITGWTIGGDESTNILNKAVIIHAGADDFTSQPSGAAGSRVACGVVRQM